MAVALQGARTVTRTPFRRGSKSAPGGAGKKKGKRGGGNNKIRKSRIGHIRGNRGSKSRQSIRLPLGSQGVLSKEFKKKKDEKKKNRYPEGA